VNYFAHYFFDHEEENPLYNFGLLLPDLLRNYSKNAYNKRILNHQRSTEIFRGAQQHLKRDKQFHQHPFFEKVQQNINDPFKNTFLKYGVDRTWFGINVIIELVLDKYLILNNLNLLNKLYDDILFSIHSDTNWLQTIEHLDPPQFINSMVKFAEYKFLEKYTEEGGTIIGLNKIYQFVEADANDWRLNKKFWKELLSLEKIIYNEITNNYNLLIR